MVWWDELRWVFLSLDNEDFESLVVIIARLIIRFLCQLMFTSKQVHQMIDLVLNLLSILWLRHKPWQMFFHDITNT